MKELTLERYKHEEFFNTLTHFPGIILAPLFFTLLIMRFSFGELSHTVAYSVYGLSFLMIYTASTVYHGTKDQTKKQLDKKIDHACIYVFMGGCYTPFILINMEDHLKYWFLFVVWCLVTLGVIYKFLSKYKNKYFSLALYLGFGFMCFLAKNQLLDRIPEDSFWFLAYGGAAYTIGAIFYAASFIPYHHAIWHLLVLMGSSLHFYAIYIN